MKKKNKGYKIWEGRNKTGLVHIWHVYVGNPKESAKIPGTNKQLYQVFGYKVNVLKLIFSFYQQ